MGEGSQLLAAGPAEPVLSAAGSAAGGAGTGEAQGGDALARLLDLLSELIGLLQQLGYLILSDLQPPMGIKHDLTQLLENIGQRSVEVE